MTYILFILFKPLLSECLNIHRRQIPNVSSIFLYKLLIRLYKYFLPKLNKTVRLNKFY